MLLATGPSFDFMQFLQICCWILLPAFFLAAILTVFLHYRKKRKEREDTVDEETLAQANPELVGYTTGDGEYICFDHSPLISEYKNRLSSTSARYTALRHDFEKLEIRYTALAGFAAANFENNKTSDMENNHETIPAHIQEEIDRLAAQYKSEKEEWLAKLEQLNQSFKSLEEENQSLQEQLNLQTATGDEREAVIDRWKGEIRLLKEKVAEHQYLQDVLDEKKAQIGFLQNQLEQRIRLHHDTEQQRLRAQSDLTELQEAQTTAIKQEDAWQAELLQKKEEIDRAQVALCAKEEQLDEQQQALHSRQEQITRLEDNLQQARGMIASLQEELLSERSKNETLETDRQSLQRIYKEFSAIMEEETWQSPVIALRPELAHENDGAAAH